MKEPRHITKLCRYSRRIALFPSEAGRVFSIPEHSQHRGSLLDILRVDVDGVQVEHVITADRFTVSLTKEAPAGCTVSLYWMHPGEWTVQIVNYLRDQETPEESHAKLMKGARLTPRTVLGVPASRPLPDREYGFQAPNYRNESYPR